MVDEVKCCVDTKVNFFEMYFSVPESVQSEVEAFIRETVDLGGTCRGCSDRYCEPDDERYN